MTKQFWNVLKVSPVIAATLLYANSAVAGEVNTQTTSVTELSQQTNDGMGQVTSVSQFSDVQPTDWAFQALQSLVERYGCIAGYPNGTYRGNRALTRYEFAAGLNACLDRVNELIATATADGITRQDLATLQRLQEEFSAELATLRGRVDALEARTAELEANQFSTTTKLKGEAIFNVAQAFGDEKADGSGDLDANTTFENRVRLSLESSFTGSDKLQVRMTSGNFTTLGTGVTGTNMTRLGYSEGGDNNIEFDKIRYSFNMGEKIRVTVDANSAEVYENINSFNPEFKSSGTGALSRYGRFSPIYRQGSGGAGLTVQLKPSKAFTASVAYLAPESSDPNNKAGVFDGDNTIFGQLEFKPSKAFNIGLAYARSYYGADPGGTSYFNSTGSSFANGLGIGTTDPVTSDNYGVQATFKPSSRFTIAGWAGYSQLRSEIGPEDASAFYWATTFAVKDLGREGNTLGLIFGQSPKITDTDNLVNGDDNGTSYHLEGLYKMQLTDNIMITPGLLVIFNPEHNDNNDTVYVGTLRTTFKF
jgi:hypothetical protein